VVEAVLRRRLDPVDGELDRMVDRRNRVVVILGTPSQFADPPGG
jgi:hypothetical protein